MKSFSLRFRTIQRLKDFIDDNDFKNFDVVVQISMPTQNLSLFHDIKTLVSSKIEDADVFAISSENSLLRGSLTDDVVINFLLFKKDSIKLCYEKSPYSLTMDSKNFYLLFGTDVDRAIITKKANSSFVVALLDYEHIIYDDIYHKGFIYLEIERDFDLDIEVVDFVEPIGRELKVTSVEEDIEIESKSLSKLYEHYLTKELSLNLQDASKSFPLLKKSEDGFISTMIKRDNKLDYKLKKDDTVGIGFCGSSKFYEIYDRAIQKLNQRYSDILFLFFSDARASIFKENGFEFEDALGSSCKSQLVIVDGEAKVLSHSIIMINLNQSSQSRLKSKRYKALLPKSSNIKEIDALANIAKVSSQELQELNHLLEEKVKKEVEKNLRKDAILIHRSRLAQMGEMLSLIAHQWKQPLSAISATSSGLHIKIELDMYDKEFFLNSLAKIEEFVNHLSNTIDDFSNFFKPTKVKKIFILADAINKAISLATYSLSKNSIDVELELDESIAIESYENELIQVLLNLVKNAENILIKREIENPKISIKLYKDEDIVIEVSDNGGGIEKSIMNKIFEPYFSTKATKDSTGLGLYMSKYIITESLEGKLLVKNSENGAVFSIILV